MATPQWILEAEENAKKYSDGIKQNNQYVIDTLVNSKNNSLNQLQKQQDAAIYNLNTNQADINKSAEENAKQANINRLLALKDNQAAMNRAGIGTQGVVGSQVNNINNSYGENLSSILNEKSSALNDLARQKNELNTTYDTNRLNITNEYDNNIATAKQQISDKALNEYNTMYNTYMNYKQQEYENQKQAEAAAEAIRQFNLQFQFQQEQAAQEQANWEKEYALSRQAAAAASSYSPVLTDGSSYQSSLTDTSSSNPANKALSSANAVLGAVASLLSGNKSNNANNVVQTYSPRLSSKGQSWYSKNIEGKSFTRDALQNALNSGYTSGKITKDEVFRIARSYGLSS